MQELPWRSSGRTSLSNAGGAGELRSPHASGPKNPNIKKKKKKQYYNKLNKAFKNGPNL